MSVEKVKKYLARYGAENRVLEFPVSSATVALAAEALDIEPCRIAKTLAFSVDGKAILVVAAGDVRADKKKYKARFGTAMKMLKKEETESLVGYAVGGICPFAVNDGVTVYLDESLRRFATVFPACGSDNSAIELTPDELEKFSQAAAWVDVCK